MSNLTQTYRHAYLPLPFSLSPIPFNYIPSFFFLFTFLLFHKEKNVIGYPDFFR